MRTLAESKVLSFLLLVLIRWNEEGRWIQDILLLLQGRKSFSSDLPRARWRNVVCVECLQMVFCFIEGWCLFLFQLLYSISQFFYIKIRVNVCCIQIWVKCETPLWLFLIKTWSTWKTLYINKYHFFCRQCKNYWITCCTLMTSHAIWVGEKRW